MPKFQVTAPKRVTEEICGVTFVKGVAEVDSAEHRRALSYFQRAGYAVTPLDEPADAGDEPDTATAPARGRAKSSKETTA